MCAVADCSYRRRLGFFARNIRIESSDFGGPLVVCVNDESFETRQQVNWYIH